MTDHTIKTFRELFKQRREFIAILRYLTLMNYTADTCLHFKTDGTLWMTSLPGEGIKPVNFKLPYELKLKLLALLQNHYLTLIAEADKDLIDITNRENQTFSK